MAIRSNWNYPTAVRFGAGRIRELPDALEVAGIKNPLLVTDAGLVNLPVTQNTLKLLLEAGAVGLNVEDTVHSEGGRMRSASEHADYVGAIRQAADAAGVDLVVCSSGGNVPRAKIPARPGYQVPFAARVRQASAAR